METKSLNCQILDRYFELTGSTTSFVNSYSPEGVKVSILSQRIHTDYIFRKSLLYVKNINRPILFASGIYYLQNIPHEMVEKIIEGRLLVGEIFGVGALKKKNDTVTKLYDARVFKALNSLSTECYKRQFNLSWDGKTIASLSEVLNAETLRRIFE